MGAVGSESNGSTVPTDCRVKEGSVGDLTSKLGALHKTVVELTTEYSSLKAESMIFLAKNTALEYDLARYIEALHQETRRSRKYFEEMQGKDSTIMQQHAMIGDLEILLATSGNARLLSSHK
jgi:predicted RNase H-like nuclease (RuvC/YqgF family)